MPETTAPSQRRRLIIGIFLILIPLMGWILFFPNATKSTADLQRLVTLKNSGIGWLENTPNMSGDEGPRAIAAFEEITGELPHEPLGYRNLAIAWLLLLEKHKENRDEAPETYQTTLSATRAAIQTLSTIEHQDDVAQILQAKLSVLLDEQLAAVEHYKAASELRPDDPIMGSEIVMLLRNHPDAELRATAIRNATKDRLDNLVLLESLVRLQADEQDGQLIQSLDALAATLQPFAPMLSSHTIDIASELPEFKARLNAGDPAAWADTRTRLIQIFNVMRQEFGYQSDLFQLQRHVLEYVIHDFSDEFYRDDQWKSTSEQSAIAMELTAAADDKQPTRGEDVIDLAIADFDLDQLNDLILLTGDHIQVFRGSTDGTPWTLLSQHAVKPEMQHILIADFDRDTTALTPEKYSIADVDILVYGTGGYQLFENRLDEDSQQRTLVPVEEESPIQLNSALVQAAVVDVENDGDLDIVAVAESGLVILQNQENWDFVDSTHHSVTQAERVQGALTLATADYNLNLQADILTPKGLFENIRHGRFRFHEPESDLFPDEPVHSIAISDIDANGSWDLLVATDSGVHLTLTDNQPGEKTWVTSSSVVSETPAEGVLTWDGDNDGLMDLVAWGSSGVRFQRGLGDGRFSQTVQPSGIPSGAVTQCKIGDLDDDGDLDMAIIANNTPWIIENNGGNQNNWLRLRLCAEPGPFFRVQRCNGYGIGSRIELFSGGKYQQQIAAGQVIHFGIGQQTRADAMRVLWTNGIPQSTVLPATRVTVTEKQELLKGSCPYLYTWTGEGYEFFTDLLWAAPIGLQFAEGVIAPTRDTEHLLIPGNRLVAIDDEYRMQVTEELWEAAYFDEIQLLAIDHPPDTSIYSNEKVGPPAISDFHIHSFDSRRLQSPVSATGSNGSDVLQIINQRDGKFTQLFDHRHKQGLTSDYFLELDLGDIKDARKIQLIMTGWVFPTDTSINIALSQNRQLPGSRPPSIWIPKPPSADSAKQQWVEIVPNMGFPGGKTKTIVVDVPVDHFVNRDYRIRIVTNMELYWDSIQVAVDPEPQTFVQSPVELLGADLHYRGYSARLGRAHSGPERYLYDQVITTAQWAPMAGHFTRYGDVTELITATDDRLVVLGSGDEMSLRFAALPDPPAGWTRDFIIKNVGWDKDADLNTVAGHRVEPLPFTTMKTYPLGPEQTIPDSPAYHRYLRKYQTRTLSRGRFWNALRTAPQN